jgi:hypothetical protein
MATQSMDDLATLEALGANASSVSLPSHAPSGPSTAVTLSKKRRFQMQERFLGAFAELGNVSDAAKAAECSPAVYYKWLKQDAFDFRERALAAQDVHNDRIAGMIRDRLTDPKGNRGSDILLMFYAKGNNPAKWREMPPQNDSAKDTLKELRQMAVRQRKVQLTIEETTYEPEGVG